MQLWLAALLSVLVLPALVSAGPLLIHGLGQDPLRLQATYVVDTGGNAIPAVFQLYSRGGERVTIRGIGDNIVGMAMVLTCPNGDTWRDGFDGTVPVIRARTTTQGWCTLTVTHRAGRGTHRDFALTYERER